MKKVLVTGISGYVGLHAAAELLKNGYSVRGSVRSLSKTNGIIEAIKKEVNSKGNLEFCELNLLNDNGWKEAMDGCDYVLHIASPYVTTEPKDENEIIAPAIEGTQRALKFAKKAGVKRVVLTSSLVAMFGNANKSINISQNTWTNTNAKNMTAYVKSKTLAEKIAWDFIKTQKDDRKLELVVINPGGIWGPTLSDKISGESMNIVKDMITGKMPMLAKASMNMSDVRDVALIHVKALENEAANGQRFIVASENPYSFKEMAQILKSNGHKKVSTLEGPNFLLNFMSHFNSDLKSMKPFIGKTYNADVRSTIEVFDWNPISFETSILDTVASVKQLMNNN